MPGYVLYERPVRSPEGWVLGAASCVRGHSYGRPGTFEDLWSNFQQQQLTVVDYLEDLRLACVGILDSVCEKIYEASSSSRTIRWILLFDLGRPDVMFTYLVISSCPLLKLAQERKQICIEDVVFDRT